MDPPGGTGNLGSASGEYREVMRYEFAPAGMTPTATNEFYLYVSHYKSGTGFQAPRTYRNGEAQIIRNDEANNLPANARVLYVGDYNVDNSGEAMYQTILSNTAPNGIHQGQGIDPLNPTNNPNINWSASTTDTNILVMLTEDRLRTEIPRRFAGDDDQCLLWCAGRVTYVPGTYHTFGNNGTTPYSNSVNTGTDTALNNDLASGAPISAAQLYLDLTNASDHLPVVADYTIPITVPAPVFQSVTATGGTVTFTWSASGQCGLSTAIQHESGPRQLEQFGERHHRDQRRHVRYRFHRAGPAAVLSSAGAITLKDDLTARDRRARKILLFF